MKKVLFSVAVVSAFAFASCGGPDLCECVNMEEPSEDCKTMQEEWEKEFKDADEDRQKEMMEELEACEKEESEGESEE